MKVYDSRHKDKLELTPLNTNEIRMYICGPTVYDDAHLGHARSAISFDLLARFLEIQGYKVVVAKNFTDIDDKLINKSFQTQTPLNELAKHYIEKYLQDMESLNVRRSHFEPRATEFLESMSNFIESLMQKDIAYRLPNGDICLEVSKDKDYGTLSKHFDDTDSIHRVEAEEGKRDQRDFVLWKAYKGQHDIGYESILGKGRPGWHIECSAMIDSVLAYKDKEFCIDIHAGGQDLFFPHHENEASQTRCLHNKELAKYWLHNGFVTINGEKMSKSLGNSFFIKDALQVYHGEILRNYLIGTHYRSPLHFNEEDLLQSKKRLDKIYRLKKRLDYTKVSLPKLLPLNTSFTSNSTCDKDFINAEEWDQFLTTYRHNLLKQAAKDFSEKFIESLNDDLNISLALSVIEEFIKEANEHLDNQPKDKIYKEQAKANLALIDFVLGLGALSYSEYFQLGVNEEEKLKIEALIKERLEAKQAKDFTKADSIRSILENMGISIMDKSKDHTEWEKF
ncbi:cysteine--tRNA ligase [Helicobacter trogontum]|uniref:Cysteine--tRNA ligase n=1 Tax=Helicobacter trogontum TaxID=50960 RepID=A0ABQ0D3S2_9HELI|nr:cysteine--tRNA ligase [Helicobacter trogontum]MDY5185053.1 cysteine--tRNA ligase [Helicobacter trogontum]